MKRVLIVCIAVFLAIDVVLGVTWLIKRPSSGTGAVNSTSQSTGNTAHTNPSHETNTSEAGTVTSAFVSSIPPNHPDHIKPVGTAIISGNYALQTWAGDVMGGQALFRYDTGASRWVMMDIGGGAWGEDSLMAVGVPRDAARALLQAARQMP
jgi:hypothetical protein